MHSALLVAAFAAGALALPADKRDYVTDVDWVVVTDVVTVYATAPQTVIQQNVQPSGPAWFSHWPSAEPTPSTTSVAVAAPSPSTTSVAVAAPSPSTTEVVVVAPTTSSSTTVATQSAPASSSTGTTYADIVISQHNAHRANHSANGLVWNQTLANIAQEIAESCNYAHNTQMGGGGYGQNIAAGTQPSDIATIITDEFYNGEVNWFAGLYGQAQPSMDNFDHWGHFSQIVWADTTSVGCYTQHCSGGLGNVGGDVSPYFTVCNYGPPGNYANEYGANIGQPLNYPTIYGNSIVASS